MPTYETLDYEVTDGRAEIFFNRPEVRNAFNDTVVEELVDALQQAHGDEAVYAIVLSGRGSAFCAGVDTTEVLGPARHRSRLADEVMLRRVWLITHLLRDGSKPTIAAINGPAVGGGFSIMLACDFRVMSEDAFLRDQHLNIGITPGPTGSWLLPRLIGESKAKEFIFLRDKISPDVAKESGLVVSVAEAGQVMEAARDVANTLRDKPAQALRDAKQLMNAEASFDEIHTRTIDDHWLTLQDPEHQEALDSWEEGRDPEFDREY